MAKILHLEEAYVLGVTIFSLTSNSYSLYTYIYCTDNLYNSEDGGNALILHLEALNWPYGGISCDFFFFSCKQLASMSQPVYSDYGELLDGGFDLKTGGICEFLHDVIYITLFVHLASVISEKFWWTYLVMKCPYDMLSQFVHLAS
ncbi:hypothetical protein PR202_ga15755 [Eleusine coracana subsp. coracana]|uniref:Uncharacterized protein n=1 Tax=Eleusine coracana subsp. coracana TaxID=191504 RepID=A0AAV5CJS4_ELECO|nr:hypothetical protein PR202_ga15755 [Eleusine coracana subsp. coracana]